MLRITVHNDSQSIRLQLEGRLAAPWLEALDECWKRAVANEGQPRLEVDLTGLTSIDRAGKASLEAMHRQGAKFIVSDCETKSIVDEILDKAESGLGKRPNAKLSHGGR